MRLKCDKRVATFKISGMKVVLHDKVFESVNGSSLQHSYYFTITFVYGDEDKVTVDDDNILVSAQDTMYTTKFGNVLRSILALYREMEED